MNATRSRTDIRSRPRSRTQDSLLALDTRVVEPLRPRVMGGGRRRSRGRLRCTRMARAVSDSLPNPSLGMTRRCSPQQPVRVSQATAPNSPFPTTAPQRSERKCLPMAMAMGWRRTSEHDLIESQLGDPERSTPQRSRAPQEGRSWTPTLRASPAPVPGESRESLLVLLVRNLRQHGRECARRSRGRGCFDSFGCTPRLCTLHVNREKAVLVSSLWNERCVQIRRNRRRDDPRFARAIRSRWGLDGAAEPRFRGRGKWDRELDLVVSPFNKKPELGPTGRLLTETTPPPTSCRSMISLSAATASGVAPSGGSALTSTNSTPARATLTQRTSSGVGRRSATRFPLLDTSEVAAPSCPGSPGRGSAAQGTVSAIRLTGGSGARGYGSMPRAGVRNGTIDGRTGSDARDTPHHRGMAWAKERLRTSPVRAARAPRHRVRPAAPPPPRAGVASGALDERGA